MTEDRIREICEPYGFELITPNFQFGLVRYTKPYLAYKMSWGELVHAFDVEDFTTEGELERAVVYLSMKMSFL